VFEHGKKIEISFSSLRDCERETELGPSHFSFVLLIVQVKGSLRKLLSRTFSEGSVDKVFLLIRYQHEVRVDINRPYILLKYEPLGLITCRGTD
jgi:hypothetical protein